MSRNERAFLKLAAVLIAFMATLMLLAAVIG